MKNFTTDNYLCREGEKCNGLIKLGMILVVDA